MIYSSMILLELYIFLAGIEIKYNDMSPSIKNPSRNCLIAQNLLY